MHSNKTRNFILN